MKTLIGVLLAVFLFAVGIASPAMSAPQGPWVLPASDISAAGQDAGSVEITTDPAGTTTAVWRRSDGNNWIIQAATRPPGGTFGTPVDLSAPGQDATAPQIATDPGGTTTALWSRFNGSNFIVQAATQPPGGTFDTPVDFSEPGQSAFGQQIAIAPDGTATVVWYRSNGSDLIIQASTRPPAGSFGAPVDLSAPGQGASVPQIATDPGGTTTVVWSRFDGRNSIVQAATRPAGGIFGVPVDLSAPGQSAFAPHVATDPDGTTTAVWQRYNGSNFIIQAATRPPGGIFGTPVDLSASGQNAQNARIAAAPDGTATVSWYRSNGANRIIQAATRPPGGSFGTPVDLSAPGQDAQNARIAAAPDGTATVIWERSNGVDLTIQAATRPPGDSFGSPVDLSAAGQNATGPQIATAADGTAIVAWQRSNGSNDIIQSASTAQPSFLLQTDRTGSGSGEITSDPPGIDCGKDCAENYPSFTEVSLTAAPESGSTFTGWSGAGCAGTGACEVTMLGATSVTAAFGRPKLANLRITPKSKKVRRGRKATFRVKTRNTGDATAKRLKFCAKGPKKQVKVPKCRKPGKLAAGNSKTVEFKVKVKKGAKKGEKAKVTFTAYAMGAKKKSGKATVRIR